MARRTTKKEETQRKRCVTCNKEKAITSQNWYKSQMPLMTDGWFYSCKDCINNLVDSNNIDSVHWMLQVMDKPWIESQWSAAMKEVNERGWTQWSSYMKTIAMPQYQGMTWKDSDRFAYSLINNEKMVDNSIENITSSEDDEIINIDYKLDEEAKRRWVGFKVEEAKILEEMYQELVMTYEHGTPIQRNLYKNIAITQSRADRAIAEGKHKEYKDLMDTLSKLMNDANIKPVQETGAEANGISSFGEFIRMIEETEPIPEPTEEFKDVDGIEKYINKWFVHPFARTFGLTNETMEEFDVKVLDENGDTDGK